MTERMTVAELHAQGLSGKIKTSCQGGELELKRAQQDVRRRDALLMLVRRLLEDGRQVRLEHRFHRTRKWRFDLALLDVKIAIEIDGGGWVQGAHHRAQGRAGDHEKDAAAQALGWRVLRCAWDDVPKTILGRVKALISDPPRRTS